MSSNQKTVVVNKGSEDMSKRLMVIFNLLCAAFNKIIFIAVRRRRGKRGTGGGDLWDSTT